MNGETFSISWFIWIVTRGLGQLEVQEPRTPSGLSTWTALTQELEPLPAVSQDGLSRKLNLQVEPGLEPRHCGMGFRLPKAA